MRRTSITVPSSYKIALVDDEQGIIDSLSIIIKRIGYLPKGFTDPLKAIEALKAEHFDLLILDYLMDPIHGDEVIRRIREFDKDLYILLLTGHRDIAPPFDTIRSLDIQGYCEKSDKFDQLILLIESGIKAVEQSRKIKQYKDGLNNVINIMPAIYKLQPIENIMESILQGVVYIEKFPNAFILLDDLNENVEAQTNQGIYKGIGKFKVEPENLMKAFELNLADVMAQARTSQKVIVTHSGAFFPLINETNQGLGILYVDKIASDYDLKLIEIYSKQAAAAISNARLHNIVNIKNIELNKTYSDLENMYIDTVQVLRLAVDAKDEYTRGHSDRVAIYAVKLGEAFGLDKDDLELLRLSGIFHDIGKIGTADDILFKTDGLDKDEYDEVKRHAIKGANILSAVSMFSNVVPIIRAHHERIDGNGYPNNLKGDEIPFLSKILSVVDAFDAMMSNRTYRKKLGLDEAVHQLEKASGTQFDAEIVKKFLELLKNNEDIHNI